MSTPVQEILMLLGDKVVEIHERDKFINQLKEVLRTTQEENAQLRLDLGKFQQSHSKIVEMFDVKKAE